MREPLKNAMVHFKKKGMSKRVGEFDLRKFV